MLIANLTHSGLTRALASELGEKNVRVNVLMPGYIETDMTEGTCHFFIATTSMDSDLVLIQPSSRSAQIYLRFILMYNVAMTPEARSEALNSVPLKRFGQAAEIADAAVFLAANQYANNCVLNLDGGLSAT